MGHLSGIATQTAKVVDAVRGKKAVIYDTRKTLPGWRRLQKYAVRCGGGHNHRSGLYDAILVKDNHLALMQAVEGSHAVESAVLKVRELLDCDNGRQDLIVEIEVDSLDQLAEVLPVRPDIVLLDNFSLDDLRAACQMRDQRQPSVQLEASGGITLEQVAAVSDTGVERISVGALTHSVTNFDVGLDWDTNPTSHA